MEVLTFRLIATIFFATTKREREIEMRMRIVEENPRSTWRKKRHLQGKTKKGISNDQSARDLRTNSVSESRETVFYF